MRVSAQLIEIHALNKFDFGPGSDNQSSVSVGPSERPGTVEGTASGVAPISKKSAAEAPAGRRHSLAITILAVAVAVVGIILAGTYAYHRLWRTPEEVANQVARDFSERVREMFNLTPRVTVNQVVVIHESTLR